MPFKHTTTDRYRPDPPYGRLAQQVEHSAVNRKVIGSKPISSAMVTTLCRKVAGEILDSWGLSFTLSLLTWG